MRHFRVSAWTLLAGVSGWLGLQACDTGAIGVDSCRNIEYARCEAAQHCPSTFSIRSVDACKRYYRDHCLHGLSLSEDPGASKVTTCVTAIKALGACAAQDESTVGQLCDAQYSATSTVCQLIQAPETIPSCAFLNPSATPSSDAGAGGTASTGGAGSTGGSESSTGGTDSTGGSAASG